MWGMNFNEKTPRKEWTTFEEVEELQKKLGLNDINFIKISCCSSSQFYRWKAKYKVPVRVLSTIRESMARYFKSEYDKKCKLIWGDDD